MCFACQLAVGLGRLEGSGPPRQEMAHSSDRRVLVAEKSEGAVPRSDWRTTLRKCVGVMRLAAGLRGQQEPARRAKQAAPADGPHPDHLAENTYARSQRAMA